MRPAIASPLSRGAMTDRGFIRCSVRRIARNLKRDAAVNKRTRTGASINAGNMPRTMRSLTMFLVGGRAYGFGVVVYVRENRTT